MDESPYILWFNECTIESIPSVGGKNASLGEMLKAGMPVPPGFAITTEAYREFLKQENNREKIKTILSDFNPDEREASDDISKNIGSLIESTPIPEEIEQAIRTAYDRLSDELGEKALAVAVRSSATAEDLPGCPGHSGTPFRGSRNRSRSGLDKGEDQRRDGVDRCRGGDGGPRRGPGLSTLLMRR